MSQGRGKEGHSGAGGAGEAERRTIEGTYTLSRENIDGMAVSKRARREKTEKRSK